MTPQKNQKLFIIASRSGRLANRLITFANLIALAEEQNHRVVNFTFHSYSDLFEQTQKNLYCEYPAPHRRRWLDRIPGVGAAVRKTRIFFHLTRYAGLLNKRFRLFGGNVITLSEEGVAFLDSPEYQEKIRPAKIIFVQGCWLRAPELVKKHGDKIRAFFRPVEKYEIASRTAIDSLRQSADVVIGVHIRQGDYRAFEGGRYFFPVERYAMWMHELAAQFPGRKVAFFVCSDEPRSAGEFFGLTVGFGSDSPVSDLYSLARCDYILGAKSTFSQWASFHGGKPLLHLYDKDDSVPVQNFRVSYLDWK